MSALKYLEELRREGFQTNLSSSDGLPYRGPSVSHVTQKQFEEHSQIAFDAGARQFDLSDEKDHADYVKLLDKQANKVVRVVEKSVKMVEQEDGSVKTFVYLEWALPYTMMPTDRLPRESRFGV